MATKYSVDVTSTAEPASADYGALARAQTERGKQAQLIGATAESLVGMYQKVKLADAEDKAAELSAEFLRSNQMATASALDAQRMEAMRPERGGAVAEAMLGAGGAEKQTAAKTSLKNFDNEIRRLKEASNSGMTNAQYVGRVNTLIKEAIAANPGMADQIRAKVAAQTGLEGADRWAQQQFVKERFTKPTATKDPLSEADMAAATIKRIAPLGTFGDEVTLTNLYRTNRPLFDRRVRAATEYLAVQTQNDSVKKHMEALRTNSDSDADKARAGFKMLFGGYTQANVLATTVEDKENIFGQTLALMSKGQSNMDPTKFKVLVDLHNAQMRTNIDAAKRTSYEAIDVFVRENPNISDAKRKELYADIDRSAATLVERYADDKGIGLSAMPNIMSSYRDKSLTEKQQLVDLAVKLQSAMPNNPLMQAYWGKGASRENLKRTNPDFYNFMVKFEENITSSARSVGEDITAAQDLSVVQIIQATGEKTGEAVAPPIVGSPTTVKAGYTSLVASAVTLLDKADLSQPEINVISSAFSTSAQYGAESQLLLSNYQKFGSKLANLNPVDLGVIKNNVSRGSVNGVEQIRQIRDVLNTKYGTNYKVGVSPEGILYMDSMSTAVSVRDPKSRAIAEEFRKQTKALSITTVYGRAMLTNEDPSAIGMGYANAINNGTQVMPFYDPTGKMTPIPAATEATVAPEEAPTTTAQDLQKIIKNNEALDTADGKKKADKEIAEEKPEFKPEGLNITSVYKDFPSQTYGKTASANKKPFAGVVLHHDPAKNMSYYGQVDKVRKGQFGYHFTIAEDGTIYQAAPMTARTNHIGNKGFKGLREDSPLDNSNAIGIAYLGGENPSPQATEAIKKLMAKLKDQYGDLVTVTHPSVSKAGHKSEEEGAVWKDALSKAGFKVR